VEKRKEKGMGKRVINGSSHVKNECLEDQKKATCPKEILMGTGQSETSVVPTRLHGVTSP
jgi:hypothetical protein